MIASELLKQVRRIQVRTGRQVADVLAGQYVSVFKGRGMEFDEVRPYVPGDDVRTIDWNVTARTGAPHVKRFVEERELTILLLVDVSPSMAFGSGARSKREAAAELAALLAFSAIHNDDKVGLLLFESGTERFIPARKGQKHAMRVVREVLERGADRAHARSAPASEARGMPGLLRGLFSRLVSTRPPSGRRRTDVGAAIEHARRALSRRAIVFVVSDFLDQGFLGPLRTANRRHDVVAVHVGDRREREAVDAGGLLTLADAETGESVVVDTGDARYRAAADETARARLGRLEADLRSSGVDLVRIDAAGSVIDPLVAFFRMRQKRSRR